MKLKITYNFLLTNLTFWSSHR